MVAERGPSTHDVISSSFSYSSRTRACDVLYDSSQNPACSLDAASRALILLVLAGGGDAVEVIQKCYNCSVEVITRRGREFADARSHLGR
jgi:hypothetical protein